jgi:hypothetical protein
VDGQCLRLPDAELLEQRLVPGPGVGQLGCRGDDGDAALAAAEGGEPPENGDVTDLFFCPTHRNDEASAIRHQVPPAAGPQVIVGA